MSKQVAVRKIPPCDLCGQPAYADAKVPGGPWGNVCREHFDKLGCQLGLGKGQQFIVQLDENPPSQDERIAARVKAARKSKRPLSMAQLEAMFEDRDPMEFL